MRNNRSNSNILRGQRRTGRSSKGSGFVELAFSIGIIMAMLIFALDICIVMIAYGINDRACRDAARAAAKGRTKDEALAFARAGIRMHDLVSALISEPKIDEDAFVFKTTGQPLVTVTTTTTTRVPAPIFLLGTQVTGNDSIKIAKTYTFPLQKLSTKGVKFSPFLQKVLNVKDFLQLAP